VHWPEARHILCVSERIAPYGTTSLRIAHDSCLDTAVDIVRVLMGGVHVEVLGILWSWPSLGSCCIRYEQMLTNTVHSDASSRSCLPLQPCLSPRDVQIMQLEYKPPLTLVVMAGALWPGVGMAYQCSAITLESDPAILCPMPADMRSRMQSTWHCTASHFCPPGTCLENSGRGFGSFHPSTKAA
jgi:hypothetical protein